VHHDTLLAGHLALCWTLCLLDTRRARHSRRVIADTLGVLYSTGNKPSGMCNKPVYTIVEVRVTSA
jgi:hypothetical protein